MFKQIDFIDAKDKTIRAVVRAGDAELIVSFTDDTFSVIDASWGSRGEVKLDTESEFYALGYRLDLELEPAFGDKARVLHDAAKRKIDERVRKRREMEKEQRRKIFEKLKDEFGGES